MGFPSLQADAVLLMWVRPLVVVPAGRLLGAARTAFLLSIAITLSVSSLPVPVVFATAGPQAGVLTALVTAVMAPPVLRALSPARRPDPVEAPV
ncbi:hypothetical protein [Streptosporangium saharense]|uniref:hypothetical protein n=1 Tax=Streptosporangium saharense TaxID=1706840 RepID=UPI00331A68DB